MTKWVYPSVEHAGMTLYWFGAELHTNVYVGFVLYILSYVGMGHILEYIVH